MAKCKITRNCKTCETLFTPWTGNAGLYCSTDCYHKNREAANARFWAQVDKSPGLGPHGTCWLWKGKATPEGYGKAGIGGAAHRRAWELMNGPIPDGLWVLHRCDNPPCVNPADLFLGTHADNTADMVSKDRSPWGSRHPNAVLTEDVVRRARALYVPRKMSYRKVAEMLGVPVSGLRAAISGQTWTYLK